MDPVTPVDSSYSHAELDEILKRGESVMIGGRIVTSPSDLPSAATLAKGNPAAEAATGKSLDAQIAELTRQRNSLTENPVNAPVTTPTTATVNTTDTPKPK